MTEYLGFWKLPPILRAKVMRRMDPDVIIDLSTTHIAVKEFLTIYKLHATKLTWTFERKDVHFERKGSKPSYHNFQINLQFSKEKSVNFAIPCKDAEQDLRRSTERIVNGRSLLMMTDENNFWVTGLKGFNVKMQYLIDLTQHLLSIIDVDEFNLHFDLKDVKVMDNFVWEVTNKFDAVRIYNGLVTMSNLSQMLEDFEIDDLFLNIPIIQENPLIPVPLKGLNKPDILRITNYGRWLSVDEFFELNNSTIDVQFEELVDASVVLRILESWLSGEKFQDVRSLTMGEYFIGHAQLMRKVDAIHGITGNWGGPEFWMSEYIRRAKRRTDGNLAWARINFARRSDLGHFVLQVGEKPDSFS
ncbi:unnamed protein product [Caenorhabditis brenneri]